MSLNAKNPEQQRAYYQPDSVIAELNVLKDQVDQIDLHQETKEALTDIVGVSKPFKNSAQYGRQGWRQQKSRYCLLGETGVGKEGHGAGTASLWRPLQKSRSFAVNCAAIPQDLIESELFWRLPKGAFTGASSTRARVSFERADGGTIFSR